MAELPAFLTFPQQFPTFRNNRVQQVGGMTHTFFDKSKILDQCGAPLTGVDVTLSVQSLQARRNRG